MDQTRSLQTTGGKAVIYLRVSTEEQVDNYSLDTQKDICTKEAQKRGLTVVKEFREEGKSAKTITGRPALIELLEFCRKFKREVDAVIVYRLDRISRQTSDYLVIRKKLAECDIQLVSATEPTGNSPTEKFIETMLAGFAQMDNDVRSERSKNGMRARFLSGLTSGYVPLGYITKDGYATKDPESFEIVRSGWKLMATGNKTLQEVADYFNKKGLNGGRDRTKRVKVRSQAVSRMFHNKFYMGKIVSTKYGTEVEGQHPPMVTEEMFYQVQAVIDGRNTCIAKGIKARRSQDNPDFPLRRIIKCGQCGASFTGGWSRGQFNRFAYYFCQRCRGSHSRVSAPAMQQTVVDYLESISPSGETVRVFNALLRRKYFERLASLRKRRDEADSEMKNLYDLRQKLIQKNLAGIYSDDVFKEQNKMIENKVKLIQTANSDGLLEKYNIEKVTDFISAKLKEPAKTYIKSDDQHDLQQIRMLISSIFPSGMVWSQNSLLNSPISEFYSAITDFKKASVAFGGVFSTQLERFLKLAKQKSPYALVEGGQPEREAIAALGSFSRLSCPRLVGGCLPALFFRHRMCRHATDFYERNARVKVGCQQDFSSRW